MNAAAGMGRGGRRLRKSLRRPRRASYGSGSTILPGFISP